MTDPRYIVSRAGQWVSRKPWLEREFSLRYPWEVSPIRGDAVLFTAWDRDLFEQKRCECWSLSGDPWSFDLWTPRGPWSMFADKTDTGFQHVHPSVMQVRMYGRSSPPVEVRVSLGGEWWAWFSSREDDPRPSFLFEKKVCFDICFPYGPKASEDSGSGQIFRVSVDGQG